MQEDFTVSADISKLNLNSNLAFFPIPYLLFNFTFHLQLRFRFLFAATSDLMSDEFQNDFHTQFFPKIYHNYSFIFLFFLYFSVYDIISRRKEKKPEIPKFFQQFFGVLPKIFFCGTVKDMDDEIISVRMEKSENSAMYSKDD